MIPLSIRRLLAVLLILAGPSRAATLPGLKSRPDLAPRHVGAVLLTELGCTACHTPGRDSLAAKAGPDLSAVGSRIRHDHLRRFIESPSRAHPGTSMPDVLGHLPADNRAADTEALVHFLVSLDSDPVPEPEAADPAAATASVERGRELYHSVGCVACHSPEAPLPDSVPLGPLNAKYTRPALTRFLEDPLAIRPSGRMPDLRLDHFEADAIAAYLLRDPVGEAPVRVRADPRKADRGRRLFEEHRCAACHSGLPAPPPPPAPPLARLRPERGCLSDQQGPWPKYTLDAAERAALRAAIAGGDRDPEPAAEVEMALARMNCRACHERNGTGGPGPERDAFFSGSDPGLGDQGRLPPPLTGVGAKLKGHWLREVIVNGAEARPYLHVRMPRFGARGGESLAAGLKATDPALDAPEVAVPDDDKRRQAGRELAGSTGFNCVACHTFRGRSAAPIRALDLTTLASRLEEGWFHRYLESPRRFSPLTIMPDFWPDGRSPLTAVLEGDPVRQRDALWQYLSEGPEAGEPRGLVLEPMVVTVSDEAVILRRAYPGIGKRGIGVGFPAGIHLAFDAEQMRLGSIWSGGFIEASALWRGQGAGQAHLLGRDRVDFPKGPAFAVLADPSDDWPDAAGDTISGGHFRGYSLDTRRRPTLRYRIGTLLVEDRFIDRIAADGHRYFERHLTFPEGPVPDGLHFRIAEQAQISALAEGRYRIGDGLEVRVPGGAVVHAAAGVRQLRIPIRGPLTIEYHLPGKP